MRRELQPAGHLHRWFMLALVLGAVIAVGGTANAQQADAGKKAAKEELLPERLKFKIDLIEKDVGSSKTVDVKIKDKDGNEAQSTADVAEIARDKIYDTVTLVITRYEGSNCTRVCKVLSNGTTSCYKVCN